MHKQHEDQPSNNLPNLSTWHRVPEGSIIPKGTPYAYTYGNGLAVESSLDRRYDITVNDDNNYYTERPLAPPLPTEDGATIVASGDKRLPPHTLLTREDGRWFNRSGGEWRVNQIRAWAPVTIGEVVVMP